MRETKKLIHTEINSQVQKSIELKRGARSKTEKRKREQIVNDNGPV